MIISFVVYAKEAAWVRGFLLVAILAASALFSTALAAEHPKLDQALEILDKAQTITITTEADKAQLNALLLQAQTLIADEKLGREWQGHRMAAINLCQRIINNSLKNTPQNYAQSHIRPVIQEINWAIENADTYQPYSVLLVPGSPTITPDAIGPDYLKISYLDSSTAKPFPKGTTYGQRPPSDTGDPNEVLLGKMIFFDLGPGKTVRYTVASGKPLTKLIFTGEAYNTMTIEIKDLEGRNLTGLGPVEGGNVDKSVEFPLPNLTHFQLIITTWASTWLRVDSLQFESNGTHVGPVAKLTPIPESPAQTSPAIAPPPPMPSLVLEKLTTDQARAVVLIAGDNAEGTGFLVKMPDGPVVVTNLHVISNNPNIKITTNTGAQIKILTTKGAADRDLALISIEDAGYSYLELADDVSKTVQTGDEVVTPGNSQGGEVMLNTGGKVLGIGPQRIEFDNPIYHGNSGGPVFHTKSNKVLGVVTEAIKVDASNEVDKASHNNKSSAIGGTMRYFGLRLDTVPKWLSIDSRRFQNETAFLDEFHQRSRCLDSFLNTSEKDPPAKDSDALDPYLWRTDPKIKKANTDCFQLASGADSSQRLDALRQLQSDLFSLADENLGSIQEMANFYSFDQQRAQAEADYRKALKTEIESYGDNLSRLRTRKSD